MDTLWQNILLIINWYIIFLREIIFLMDKRTKALEHLQLISDKGIEKLIKNIGTLKYLDKIPIRRSGDRTRYFFQFLTHQSLKVLVF